MEERCRALALMNEALDLLEGSGLDCAAAKLAMAIDTIADLAANDNLPSPREWIEGATF